MKRKELDQNQTMQGGEHATSGNNGQFGNKSFAGATSTDSGKQRMQAVEANELHYDDPGEGNTGYDRPQGAPNNAASRSEMDNRTGEAETDHIMEAGTIKTAVFDEGKKPRAAESPGSAGATQGSEDRPAGEQML